MTNFTNFITSVVSLEISLIQFFPEIFLAISILLLTVHTTLLSTTRFLGYPLLTQSLIKLCFLIFALTLFLITYNNVSFIAAFDKNFFKSFLAFNNTFIFDSLSQSSKQLLLISVFFCLFISEKVILKNKINTFEYFILLLCATLGLLFLMSAYDLISLYLAIEIQSLCLYVLAASKKKSSFSLEAGLKYFILGSFSSALFLFGASLLYACTGTTNFYSFFLFFSGLNLELFSLQISVEHA